MPVGDVGDAVDDWLVPTERRTLIRSTQHLNRRVEQVNDKFNTVVERLDERIKALEAGQADGQHGHRP